jgi:hypothetical protein
MRRFVLSFAAAAMVALALAPTAPADFGLKELDVTFNNADGSIAPQAGAHPFSMTTTVGFNTRFHEGLGYEIPDENPRDLVVAQMPGLIGDRTAVPTCTNAEFLSGPEQCPESSQVGVNDVTFQVPGNVKRVAVYSLAPPPGVAVKLGFHVEIVPVTVEVGIEESPPSNIVASLIDIPNVEPVYRSELTLWGVPADPAHDKDRGGPVNLEPKPLLTTPRSCTGALPTSFEARSWEGSFFAETILTHDDAEPTSPLGMIGCGKLGFNPSLGAQPTSLAASSPSGMDVTLEVKDEGLTSPDGLAQSDIREAIITLPQGMTANPSVAEGLEVCSEAQLEDETAFSSPGQGCPEASKIGTVEVQTPLVEEILSGSIYQAKPYENLAGDSLIALYLVIKNRDLGVVFKQPVRVEPDAQTGQLVGISEDVPPWPFSRLKVHFREGGRSPLITPPRCGSHSVEAELYPSAGGAPKTVTSSFQIVTGPNGTPCPAVGKPPFKPGFEAGSLNNNAGSYSPFYMRWTRRDGDQDITRFSAKLPPGLVAKLAGTRECRQAAIEAAKAKTGLEERLSPSCPPSSQIGRVVAGAGVGAQLTYVPGKVYLAGPYKGAPLSAVGIVPAVAGPFDIGTVVTQQALRVDPRTAEVTADGSSSDPIPHILAGIPLKVRDIRVYVDRPSFTLNPTSCEPSQVAARLWGGGSDLFSASDDSPFSLTTPFQAANCANLGFKPRIALRLKGGTKRGDFPALRAEFRPRAGDANLKRLALRFPRSVFIEQGHLRTICTRVQFAADACPPGAIYGRVRAFTPILDEPLEGPVYLRSSDNELPDAIFVLRGRVDAEVAVRIDSVKGVLRTTVEEAPDVPVSRVVVNMQGGKRGVLVNSANLCKAKQRAKLRMTGHNGRRSSTKPLVRASGCAKKQRRRAERHSR